MLIVTIVDENPQTSLGISYAKVLIKFETHKFLWVFLTLCNFFYIFSHGTKDQQPWGFLPFGRHQKDFCQFLC